MNHIGSIQAELDRLTDFANEEGRFPDPVVDVLNDVAYQIQIKAEFEILKLKMIEKKLSELIFKIMDEHADLEPDLKKYRNETLLG